MKTYTFGYERLEVKSFIVQLERAGVRKIIDVREVPLSRKKGFSKNALSAALQARGIEYVHMAALGCPKPIRERFKQDGDWRAYERSFCRYLGTQADAVRWLARAAKRKAVCLLCFETDYSRCHRTLVARAAVACGAPRAVHLTPETEVADVPLKVAA